MATTTDKYVLDAQLNASNAIKNSTKLTSSLGKLMKQVFTLYAAMKALRKSIDLIGNSLQDASKMQQWNISFEVMLGSAEKAKVLMEEISDFAKTTPFILPDVVSNTKMLMAMNIESENVIDTMRMLGDISAGTGADLSRLALNLGQVASLGKLSGREIRDFAMAGLDVLKPLEKILGKTASELKEMTSKGEISFDMVMQSLKAMTSEGGKFDNLMGRLVNTLPAQVSNLKDQFFRLSVTFGKELLPVAIDFVKQMKHIADDEQTKQAILILADAMIAFAKSTKYAIKVTDEFLNLGIAAKIRKSKDQEKYMQQINKMGVDELAALEFQQKFEINALWKQQQAEDKAHENNLDNLRNYQREHHVNLISRKKQEQEMIDLWLQRKDAMNEEFILLEKKQKIINDTIKSQANQAVKTTVKMKLILDEPTFEDDDQLDEVIKIEPTIVISQEEIDNLERQVIMIQDFIDSSLTSAVTGFYDQLLSGKNTIEDWGNFFLSMLKRIIAQMLVMQTLYAINPLMGGAANIFGSLFGGGGSTLSAGAVSAGAGAITNNDGLERLAEVLSNQSINVNINPNAFIQSADTRILSQQNEIGTIQRGITSL